MTELQLSWATATPVLFVLVLAGHSSTTFDGQMSEGAVVPTMIVCTTLVVLPESSVAVQVREIIFVPEQPLLTMSL